jgi:hypothetical protein
VGVQQRVDEDVLSPGALSRLGLLDRIEYPRSDVAEHRRVRRDDRESPGVDRRAARVAVAVRADLLALVEAHERGLALLQARRLVPAAEHVLGAVHQIERELWAAVVLVPGPRHHLVHDHLARLVEGTLRGDHRPDDRLGDGDRVAAEDALHDERLARATAAGQEQLGEAQERPCLAVERQVLLDHLAHPREDLRVWAPQVIRQPPIEQLDRLELSAVDRDHVGALRVADERLVTAIPQAAEPRDVDPTLLVDPVDLQVKKSFFVAGGRVEL